MMPRNIQKMLSLQRTYVLVGLVLCRFGHAAEVENVISNVSGEKELLQDFLSNVRVQHEQFRVFEQRVRAAEANLQGKLGVFDPKIYGGIRGRTGKNEWLQGEVGVKTLLPWYGVEASVGYENSDGIFEDYEGAYRTTVGGDWVAKLRVPVLRGGWYDEARWDRDESVLKLELVNQEVRGLELEFQYEALEALWRARIAERKRRLYEEMVTRARERVSMITSEVNAGNRAEIDLVEAHSMLDDRNAHLKRAEAKLSSEEEKLSFFAMFPKEGSNALVEQHSETLEEHSERSQ